MGAPTGVRRIAPFALTLAALITWTGAGSPLRAQSCGLVAGTGVAAAVGLSSYDAAGGLAGPAVGADATMSAAPISLRLGYRRVLLDGPEPDIGRAAAAVPLPFSVLGLDVCATGHAGAARLTTGADASTVLAGGLGLRLSRALSMAGIRGRPYAEVRGLGARSSGTIMAVDVTASGMAVGVEGGIMAAMGGFTVGLAASMDGFDEGLGLAPYPSASAELRVGIRF
jgi:hypothetical protein